MKINDDNSIIVEGPMAVYRQSFFNLDVDISLHDVVNQADGKKMSQMSKHLLYMSIVD